MIRYDTIECNTIQCNTIATTLLAGNKCYALESISFRLEKVSNTYVAKSLDSGAFLSQSAVFVIQGAKSI